MWNQFLWSTRSTSKPSEAHLISVQRTLSEIRHGRVNLQVRSHRGVKRVVGVATRQQLFCRNGTDANTQMKALVQEGQSSNIFSLSLVEFLWKIQNTWDEKVPRMAVNSRKRFIRFSFSTVESKNTAKMSTKTTCHHHIKSEAILSLGPEQQQKKCRKPKAFSFSPHYSNSFDLESKLVKSVNQTSLTVIYCSLTEQSKGQTVYICAGFSSDFHQRAHTALSTRVVPKSTACARKEARLMLNWIILTLCKYEYHQRCVHMPVKIYFP